MSGFYPQSMGENRDRLNQLHRSLTKASIQQLKQTTLMIKSQSDMPLQITSKLIGSSVNNTIPIFKKQAAYTARYNKNVKLQSKMMAINNSQRDSNMTEGPQHLLSKKNRGSLDGRVYKLEVDMTRSAQNFAKRDSHVKSLQKNMSFGQIAGNSLSVQHRQLMPRQFQPTRIPKKLSSMKMSSQANIIRMPQSQPTLHIIEPSMSQPSFDDPTTTIYPSFDIKVALRRPQTRDVNIRLK